MERPATTALAILLLLTGAAEAAQDVAHAASQSAAVQGASPYLQIEGPTTPPPGFIGFCRKQSQFCDAGGQVVHRRLPLTRERWGALESVNLVVNRTVNPRTDLSLYGVEEFWTMPRTSGDCEDYVLLKRQMLMKHGWPVSALLITVVIDEIGNGHAVLIARTANGDFVLDNRTDIIAPWNETRYVYVKRQSYRNPTSWVALRTLR